MYVCARPHVPSLYCKSLSRKSCDMQNRQKIKTLPQHLIGYSYPKFIRRELYCNIYEDVLKKFLYKHQIRCKYIRKSLCKSCENLIKLYLSKGNYELTWWARLCITMILRASLYTSCGRYFAAKSLKLLKKQKSQLTSSLTTWGKTMAVREKHYY